MITSACAYGRAGEGQKRGEMPVLLHFVIVYMLLQQQSQKSRPPTAFDIVIVHELSV